MHLRKLIAWTSVTLLLAALPAAAQDATPEATNQVAEAMTTTWVPIGGFYTETFPGFIEAALPNVERFATDRLYILVMPMTFSYDAAELTTADLLLNTSDAERRRRQLEDVCSDIVPPEIYCEAVVPPIYTREAAEAPEALDYFADDLAAVYFLGGDQTIAMQITAGTPLETALAEAFARGVVMGGNSAGLAIESRVMIGGYNGDFGPESGFASGAVDVWNDQEPGRRGLDFGLTNAVVEQHFWERARLPRLINALVQDDVPGVGIGVDSFTGALIRDNNRLEGAFGLYTGAIFDVESLGARTTATFENDAAVLSARNILFHTFAPGDFAYDIDGRTHSLAAPPSSLSRDFVGLTTPEGAGDIVLYGNLAGAGDLSALDLPDNTTALITGYASPEAAGEVELLYTDSPVTVINLDDGGTIPALTDQAVVIVHASDASLIDIEALRAPLQDAWLGGTTLILDNAAAAVVGQQYTAMPPTPFETDDDLLIEEAVQAVLIDGGTALADGLGFLPITVEPQLMADYRWGRWVALAFANPGALALGLPDETAITITADGATVSGTNSAVALDLSGAALAVGENGGLVIANGVIDIFAPGDAVAPQNS
ncbi:MAG: hypothetical protein SF162_12055 [bacterium]|nr:hypothetical protein [bacterium]